MTTTLAVQFDERKIDAIFAEFEQCQLPGAAVGVAIGGKPVYRKGFGLASMELPVVLTPSMRIRVGSVSKNFTCLAYLLLCEEGMAAIDDPLGKHLPEVHPVSGRVPMRLIMGNISGLRDAMGLRSQFSGHIGVAMPQVPSTELLSLYNDIDDFDAEPGTTWIYNNGGFGLVSTVLERITGQTYEQVMWERVFEPLGMYDSLVRRWDTDFVPNSATGHDVLLTGSFSRAYYGFSYDGAGAIVSTVDDMLIWLANIDRHRVGNAETWAAMTTAQTLVNGTSSGYGFGLKIASYRGAQTIQHGGGWIGTAAQMLKVPAAGLDVIVMANRDDSPSALLANRIIDACVSGLDPVEEPRAGQIFDGIFRSPTSGRIAQLFARDGKQLVSIDGMDAPLDPHEDGVTWSAASGRVNITMTRVGDAIRITEFGNVEELLPLQPASGDPAAIAGRYRAATTGTDVSINSDARMTSFGRFGTKEFKLDPIAHGIWKASSTDFRPGILTFDEDGSGFAFSDNGTRRLRFSRLQG